MWPCLLSRWRRFHWFWGYQERGCDIVRFKGCLLPDSYPSRFSALPWDSHNRSLLVQSVMLWFFYSSPGPHQGFHSCVTMGSQERNSTPLLPWGLADHRRVGSSCPGVSGDPPSTLPGPGDCWQYGEVRPQQLASVKWLKSKDSNPSLAWVRLYEGIRFVLVPT